MLTLAVMFVIVAFLGYILLVQDARGKKVKFFDLDTTCALRGFWCLIVLLVHIPADYQNPVQDMLGSFAYIGVSFFFMTSAYGLFAGLKKSGGLVTSFWRKRLPKLLLPMFISNILNVMVRYIAGESWKISDLLAVTGWVQQLLIFYGIFWMIYGVLPNRLPLRQKNMLLCFCVTVFSLLTYFHVLPIEKAWPTESFGFLYGACLIWFGDRFKRFSEKRWMLKCSGACLASALFGAGYLLLKQHVFWGDYLLKVVLGFLILLFMLLWNVRIPIGNAVGRFLGKISYEIYLLHGTAFLLLQALAENWNSGLYVAASMTVTVGLAMGVQFVCKTMLKGLERRRIHV